VAFREAPQGVNLMNLNIILEVVLFFYLNDE